MKRVMRVVPSILTEDTRELERMVAQAETFTDCVQFDIMDGDFVPSRGVTSEALAALRTRLNWEAHLMVLRPATYLDAFKEAGARRVIFHYEATDCPRDVISAARELGLQVGLAVNPETPVSSFLPLSPDVDSILFLSVHPGFYGKEFIREVLAKVAEYRAAQPGKEIGIDGGIKEGNIARVAASGADAAYIGSAIFRQPDPAQSYQRLAALASALSRGRGESTGDRKWR